MSDAALHARPWAASPIAPEARGEVFREARSRADEMQRTGRAFRRTGYLVGASGCVVGLAGMICAASVFPLKTVENHWILVDHTTGEMGEAVGPKDAPKLFGKRETERALREYVENREGYVADTADLMSHRVAVMSSPEEQNVYSRWFSPHSNQQSPQLVYGNKTSVRAGNFRFTPLGVGRQKTEVYQVRFDKVVVTAGEPGNPEPWIATIQFQWHPELAMNSDVRTINPGGLQVIAYGSQSEIGK